MVDYSNRQNFNILSSKASFSLNKMILFNLILVVYFTLSECSLNCNLLNEFSMPELTIGSQSEPTLNTTSRNGSSVTPLSFWEFDPMFGKCGIVPAGQ